jgi:hypothetical protein
LKISHQGEKWGNSKIESSMMNIILSKYLKKGRTSLLTAGVQKRKEALVASAVGTGKKKYT